MTGKTTLTINNAHMLEALQLWANKTFTQAVKVSSVKSVNVTGNAYDANATQSFEIVVEPLGIIPLEVAAPK